MPLILGHRGARLRAPQNTLPAFQAAIDHGADGVEFDVQLTKDGHLVIHHDFSIEQDSNGHGFIASMTFADLRALDFGSWFAPEFEGTQIPTLAETLDCVKDMKYINVELKRPLEPWRRELVEKTVAEVKNAGLTDKVVFSSFDYQTVDRIKELDPSLECGLLYDPLKTECYDRRILWPCLNLKVAAEHGVECLHPYYANITYTPNYLKDAHAAGLKVNLWGIKDHQEDVLAKFKATDVDSIITDLI